MELDYPSKSGETLRQGLESTKAQFERMGKEFKSGFQSFDDPTPISLYGKSTLDYFLTLSSCRSYSELGPSPISFTEIKNWSELMQIDLEPWQARAIIDMDRAYIQAVLAKDK